MRVIDPCVTTEGDVGGDGRVHYARLVVLTLSLFLPLVIASAIPSAFVGGQLFGNGGLTRDVGLVVVLLYYFVVLLLLVHGRRVLGDLINELTTSGALPTSPLDGRTLLAGVRGPTLRALEWLTRISPLRTVIWACILVLLNSKGFYDFMADQRTFWGSTAADPNSIGFALRVGQKQPNLAGAWSFLVWNPAVAYLAVLVARLFTCFAAICQAIAAAPDLRILPTHPDKTGGLLCVGQASIFMALFTLAVGVALAGMTIADLVMMRASHLESSSNLANIVVFWGVFLPAGTLLFFLPVLPLRPRMAAAKRAYLLQANALFAELERFHREACRDVKVGPVSAQEQTSVMQLIDAGRSMAVWPFDWMTLIRFSGILLGPLSPVLLDQLPRILDWLRAYLHLNPVQ